MAPPFQHHARLQECSTPLGFLWCHQEAACHQGNTKTQHATETQHVTKATSCAFTSPVASSHLTVLLLVGQDFWHASSKHTHTYTHSHSRTHTHKRIHPQRHPVTRGPACVQKGCLCGCGCAWQPSPTGSGRGGVRQRGRAGQADRQAGGGQAAEKMH
eukprot:1158280-Pelagomonas_calceolata.AAC.4